MVDCRLLWSRKHWAHATVDPMVSGLLYGALLPVGRYDHIELISLRRRHRRSALPSAQRSVAGSRCGVGSGYAAGRSIRALVKCAGSASYRPWMARKAAMRRMLGRSSMSLAKSACWRSNAREHAAETAGMPCSAWLGRMPQPPVLAWFIQASKVAWFSLIQASASLRILRSLAPSSLMDFSQ